MNLKYDIITDDFSELKYKNTITDLIRTSTHDTLAPFIKAGHKFEISPSKFQDLLNDLINYRQHLKQHMNSTLYIDEHKISAIITALFFKYLPIKYKIHNTSEIFEGKYFNAIVALNAALDLLIFYQIDDIVPYNDTRFDVLKMIRGSFVFTNKSKDNNEVVYQNLINALYRFDYNSITDNKLREDMIKNSLWLFANMYYLLDINSRESNQILAQKAYDNIRGCL